MAHIYVKIENILENNYLASFVTYTYMVNIHSSLVSHFTSTLVVIFNFFLLRVLTSMQYTFVF